MKINVLEGKIENIEGSNLYSIIDLIINAVRDYPLYGLDDTDLYFQEIRRLLESEHITSSLLKEYLERNQNKRDENNSWVMSSIGSLLDAFGLMILYKISFEEVLYTIKKYSSDE